jgi:hypothetical protein
MSMRRQLLLALVLASVTLGSCGAGNQQFPVQRTPSPIARLAGGRPAHIVVILMENHEYGQVIGDRSAPYINGLAQGYGLADEMHAISHPSLPNYLALTGGSTFGINSDCTGCKVHATSIVDQLEHAGISWKAYMEGLPYRCFTGGDAGDYAKRHDPFIYYTDVTHQSSWCSHVVGLSQLFTDERNGSLPQFIWITPNVCHDMHDCGVATGDRFLSHLLPPLLGRLGSNGVLFLTWDEGLSDAGCCRLASGGRIATIVAGAGARRHARMKTAVDHYSVLQAVEDLFGLPRLRGAACACTPSLQPLIRR